jgi:hypothetical protein
MPVRPSFNIDKESWITFKREIPEFEPALEKFASEVIDVPLPVARLRFILNLLSESDRKLQVYLNLATPPELTKQEIIDFNCLLRKQREKLENTKYLEDFDKNKLRKMPPVASKNKEDMIELICYAFPNITWDRNEPFSFYTNSFYEVMEMKEWFRQYGIKNEFYYLPEDNLHAYLIKLV